MHFLLCQPAFDRPQVRPLVTDLWKSLMESIAVEQSKRGVNPGDGGAIMPMGVKVWKLGK